MLVRISLLSCFTQRQTFSPPLPRRELEFCGGPVSTTLWCFEGSGNQCRAPRWDGCWRSLTEGRPCWWSPHHRTKVEPADALPSCAGGSSTTRNVHTLTDLSSSNGAEVELVSLIEEQLPRYRLRADTLTEFGGKSLSLHERQSW
ncbi:hypothetical protein MRX96_004143 [Rhipicephalus microplus]